MNRNEKSLFVVRLGLGVNIILSLVKTSIGLLANSPALLAEGINSTSDVAYYIIATIFTRLAHTPADDEHPYGHQQFESIAALMVGAFVITTAIAIFWNALDKTLTLWQGAQYTDGAAEIALWVALGTVFIKAWLTQFVQKLGRDLNNPMIVAMAYDHRNDLMSASAAALGIFLGQRGFPWVDPLAGALVSLLILRTGVEIVREATDELMDTIPSRNLLERVLVVLGDLPYRVHLEEMQAHRFGQQLVINLTVGLDGNLTIAEGDAIANHIERALFHAFPNLRRVHIHYHPSRAECQNLSPEEVLARSRHPVFD
jgi:cation diffusion facilitator family transporter